MTQNANDPSSTGTIDLDAFLMRNVKPTANQAGGQSSARPRKLGIAMPETDRVVAVGIVVDDSGSMEGYRQAVIEGLNLSVEAFRGAKGSDFFLDIRGFKGQYFKGLLKDILPDTFNGYVPNYGHTPLISVSINQLNDLREQAKQYRDLGIPATISQLLITDAEPNGESYGTRDYLGAIESTDYLVGMGISDSRHSEAHENTFRELFESMGISTIVTPRSNAADIRHAINQFSQSVASIASLGA